MDEDDDIPEQSDAEALKARREALRGFVDGIAEHLRTIDLPQSFLEAERAARTLTVTDRALQVLPAFAGDLLAENDAPKIAPLRRHIRKLADKVMGAARIVPKPDTWLEGERASRYALACDRMLGQLYEAPKPVKVSGRMPVAVFEGDEEMPEDDVSMDWNAFEARRTAYELQFLRVSGMRRLANLDAGHEAEMAGLSPEEALVRQADYEIRRQEMSDAQDRTLRKHAEARGQHKERPVSDRVTPHVPDDESPGIRSLSP